MWNQTLLGFVFCWLKVLPSMSKTFGRIRNLTCVDRKWKNTIYFSPPCVGIYIDVWNSIESDPYFVEKLS